MLECARTKQTPIFHDFYNPRAVYLDKGPKTCTGPTLNSVEHAPPTGMTLPQTIWHGIVMTTALDYYASGQ